MGVLNVLNSIPSNAARVRCYVYKALDQDLSMTQRVSAMGRAIVCSIGNVIIYGFLWPLDKVVTCIFWVCGSDKVYFHASLNFHKSYNFVIQAISILIFDRLNFFSLADYKELEKEELTEELSGFFDKEPEEMDLQINKDLPRMLCFVNGARVEKLEDLKSRLSEFLREDEIPQSLCLYHQGFFAFSWTLADNKIKKILGDNIIAHQNLSKRLSMEVKKNHVILKGFSEYSAWNGDAFRSLPFAASVNHTIELDFESSVHRMYYNISCRPTGDLFAT